MTTQLRQRRLAKGISARQLARILNVSRETSRLWELGRARPRPKYFSGLEAVFGLTVEELLKPESETTPANARAATTQISTKNAYFSV